MFTLRLLLIFLNGNPSDASTGYRYHRHWTYGEPLWKSWWEA